MGRSSAPLRVGLDPRQVSRSILPVRLLARRCAVQRHRLSRDALDAGRASGWDAWPAAAAASTFSYGVPYRGMAQNLPRSVDRRRRPSCSGSRHRDPALLAWTVIGLAWGGQASQAGRMTRVLGLAHHCPTADGCPRSADHRRRHRRPARLALVPTPTPTSASAGLPAAASQARRYSLVPGEGSYGRHVHPQFNVYVVSIGKWDCSSTWVHRYLSVVIKSGGITRIWSSADCMKDIGSRLRPAEHRRAVGPAFLVGPEGVIARLPDGARSCATRNLHGDGHRARRPSREPGHGLHSQRLGRRGAVMVDAPGA